MKEGKEERKGKMQEGQKEWKNEGRKEKQIVNIECGPAQLLFFLDTYMSGSNSKKFVPGPSLSSLPK